VNILCRTLLMSCLLCPLATAAEAQDGQSHTGLSHHPPQDQLLHEKFYSTWRMPDHPSVSCCNDADCYPTEIRYVDGNIYAKRREDGSTFPFHRKRSSGIETTRTAETISALLHRTSFVLRIPCSASRWEVPHEIRVGERQVALPTILLRGMRRADRQTLPAGSWDAPDLLRSQLLCRSLQQRRPASRKSIKSIMSLSRPTKRVL